MARQGAKSACEWHPGSYRLTVGVGECDCGWNAVSDTSWGAGEVLTALAELHERWHAAGLLLGVDVHDGGRYRAAVAETTYSTVPPLSKPSGGPAVAGSMRLFPTIIRV